jgi:hypothetical protein
MTLLDKKYTIELDAADIDVLYTLVAGQEEGMRSATHRMGRGVVSRAFNNMHRELPRNMPSPAQIRAALREEGKWSVAPEPDWDTPTRGDTT